MYIYLGIGAFVGLLLLILKIQHIRADRIEEQFSLEILRRRCRESTEVDENGYRIVNLEGLFR